MRSRSLTTLALVLFIFIAFSSGYVLGQSPVAPVQLFDYNSQVPESAQEVFDPFWEVWELVQTRYYDQPVDNVALTEGAIEGMLAVLDDPHSRYLSPEDEAATRQRMEGEFEGIGAEVSSVEGDITIVSPIAGSPAEAAGLQPGDIIREADGVDLTGKDLIDAVMLVRGPKGTAVSLTIERNDERFTVDVVRDVIEVPSVLSELLEDDIAYVRLTQFGNRTSEELEDALTFLATENPKGMVLDLRRNPGGGLDTAIQVADQFLPEGTVLVEEFGNGRSRVFESGDEGLAEEVPLVVLIDEGSASASEVLAGAIRDRERGILIGQSSFGKGTVQTWHQLSNNGGVRLTIARWLTPDENWIHESGLEPDYFVPLPEGESPGQPEDTQLQAAIDYLQGETIISVPPEPEG